MIPTRLLEDYTMLIESIGIYNFVVEREDYHSYKELVEADEWYETLTELAKKYQVDKEYMIHPDKYRTILEMEDVLINKLREMIINK